MIQEARRKFDVLVSAKWCVETLDTKFAAMPASVAAALAAGPSSFAAYTSDVARVCADTSRGPCMVLVFVLGQV